MRYLSIVLFVLLPSFAIAEPMTPRPLDPVAADAFARARERSAMVRTLVATLENSNVLVHIESSLMLPAGIGGMTRFVTSRGGYRYLRITISSDLSQGARSAILGHELQHACEIAESDADDLESMRRLFEAHGDRYGSYFETRAAIETEKHVRLELRASRLQAEPVAKFDH